MSMSPFAFLYLLLLLIVCSTPVMLQEDPPAKCSPSCNETTNVTSPSPTRDKPPAEDALPPTSQLPQPSGTTTPLPPALTGSDKSVLSNPGPDTVSAVGTSSVWTAKTDSQQGRYLATSAPGKSTPPTGGGVTSIGAATSVSTPPTGGGATSIGAATSVSTPPTGGGATSIGAATSVSTPAPVTATDRAASTTGAQAPPPGQASPAGTAATSGGTRSPVVAMGTKVAVVEVAGAPLTRQLVDTASLLAIVLFGLVFFLVSVAVFVSRAYESYRRKDYTQVDYLINGMYNDSGV